MLWRNLNKVQAQQGRSGLQKIRGCAPVCVRVIFQWGQQTGPPAYRPGSHRAERTAMRSKVAKWTKIEISFLRDACWLVNEGGNTAFCPLDPSIACVGSLARALFDAGRVFQAT